MRSYIAGMNKWLFLPFCLLSMLIQGQAKVPVQPAEVLVDEVCVLPPAFALAETHYRLISYKTVIGLKVISDTALWEVKISESDDFVLRCRKYGRSEIVTLDTVIHLRAKLLSGDSLDLFAPIEVYAPVKITPNIEPLMIGSMALLNCTDNLSFLISWDYPPYVKQIFRVYGVFEIEVLAEGIRVDGITGWYDSGDRTKFRDYSMHCGKSNLVIHVRSMKTLHRYKQNGQYVPLLLSTEFPSEWELF